MYIIFIVVLCIIDQVTKYLTVHLLKGGPSFSLIDGFLQLTYLENRGAAFGVLQNKQQLFLVMTLIISTILIYFFIKRPLTKLSRIAVCLILAGAFGNLIDRIRLGYVIDMIDVVFGKFYDFPVFNFADSCVVVGTIIFSILLIFDKYEEKWNEL